MKFDSDMNNTREMPTLDIESFRKVSDKLTPRPEEDTARPERMGEPEEKIKTDTDFADFYAKKPEVRSSEEFLNQRKDVFSGPIFRRDDPDEREDAALSKPLSSGGTGGTGFDDFVIGKGFNIEEKSENITLHEGTPHKKIERKTTAAPNGKKQKRKKGGSGCLSAVIWVFVILVVSASLAVGVIVGVSDVYGIGKEGTSDVNIAQGSSTADIAETLKDAGSIRVPILFRLYSKLKKTDGTYQYGLYTIKNEGGYDGIISQLQKDGAKAETIELRISEMSTVKKIAAQLEESGVCTASDFMSVMNNTDFDYDFVDDIPTEMVAVKMEGYLFPDTYEFYVTDDSKTGAEFAIRKMLQRTSDIWTDERRQKAADMGYSIHQIMTMASIIELEAGGSSEADMQNVAAVFYNRLNWSDKKLLGSSPTAAYAELYDNDRYNTNITEGLPPGPLCAPSENAIDAALNPTQNFGYYYFVTDSTGAFHYSTTLAEHNSTISSLKAQGLWLGDGDLTSMFQ